MKSFVRLVTFAITVSIVVDLHATGFYGPMVYLDNGGKNVDASPEFYWELEVKRLAGQFHPAEKRIAPPAAQTQAEEEQHNFGAQFTAENDAKDFADALSEGRLKPSDATKVKQQHEAARAVIAQTNKDTTAALPTEFDSEFADYHHGAFAYRRGPEHWEKARTAWENLLKRPERERHYRTVWAAFMLGKIALKTGDYPGAANWFRRTRELAKTGFVDSLGMAADTYGWEGRAEWKQGHLAEAARLFLTQLALGDETAIVSLKALVPDREAIEGMLNYGPEPEERSQWNDQQKRDAEQKEMAQLKIAARDSLLRRLVTAHILSTSSSADLYSGESGNAPVNRCARWLAIIQEIKPDQVDDAEYLGWVAYNNGDYKGADHWLELAKAQTPAAFWLRAKLQRRAGNLADATKSMAQAWTSLRDNAAYTGWHAEPKPTDEDYVERGRWRFSQSAGGDLAGLRLARADFVQALDTFLNGDLWDDAAFIAERVLTADELKKYVDQNSPATQGSQPENNMSRLRYLLGRRLVREDRYSEAESYLKPPYDKILQRYVKALNDGANAKLSKLERARAWFTAGWLARYDGMELMGTEAAPDAFANGGNFEVPDLARQRRAGIYKQVRYTANGEQETNAPVILKPSKQELQRLASNKVSPDVRFHYRLIAGALAIRAAELLPNDSAELADVVNHAGIWVKEGDEKVANRYFQILERRSSKSEIGRAAIRKHWFVDQNGPWSTEQAQGYDALHKELKLETPTP